MRGKGMVIFMSKQILLQAAVHELLHHGLPSLRVSSLAQRMQLPISRVSACFPGGDWQLRMDTVEYAGKTWVEQIRCGVRAQKTAGEKLSLLTRAYALGSRDFPAALDSYLDLWKAAREGDEELRHRLCSLYQYYADQFVSIAREAGARAAEPECTAFAQCMTLLSDMLHLQRTLGNPVDFAVMGRLLERLAATVLLEE